MALLLNASNAGLLATASTTESFAGSIGTGAGLFGGFVLGFLLLKDTLPRLYQPKSYLLPDDERPELPPSGFIPLLVATWTTPSLTIIRKCGLDAYFFLRFLAMLVKIFTPLVLVVMPILLCVNGIGGREEGFEKHPPFNNTPDTEQTWRVTAQKGLNVLTWGNVRPDQAHRYWAHLILAVLVVGWCLYVFQDELRQYIALRQAYLLSPQHRIRASATTVLIQSIPEELCTQQALTDLMSPYGAIRNIWINRDYEHLLEMVKERDQFANKLESALTELAKRCRKAFLRKYQQEGKEAGRNKAATKAEMQERAKKETAGALHRATTKGWRALERENDELHKSAPKVSQETQNNATGASEHDSSSFVSVQSDSGAGPSQGRDTEIPETTTVTSLTGGYTEPGKTGQRDTQFDHLDVRYDPRDDAQPLWKNYVQEKDRPTMRLPLWNQGWLDWVPWTGEKVDKIDYCRKEVARLTEEIERQQAEPEKFKIMNSAFIRFQSQASAHMACRLAPYHMPNQMAPRILEISPGDVIWENMSMTWKQRWFWSTVVFFIIVGLIILYALPAAFIGLLSHLSVLAHVVDWLNWIDTIPGWAQSAIQGVLPTALTGLLLFLVPLIMRALSRLRGTPTGMLVELDVSTYYFWFSFVELFLVITVAAGLLPLLKSANDLVQGVPALIATNIPSASSYYISYLLLQGLSNSSSNLFQIGQLFLWFVLAPLNDTTPREKWRRQISLPTVPWGSFFPVFSNLACIGLIYSIVAPLMIVFNLISFCLFWAAYRYLTIYVNTFKFDSGGALFPRAVNQLFVGLYFMEVCLIALFFAAQGVDESNGDTVNGVCVPQGVIMIFVLVGTIIAQTRIRLTLSEYYEFLPMDVLTQAAAHDERFALEQNKKFGLATEKDDGDAQSTGSDVKNQAQADRLGMVDQHRRRTAKASDSEESDNTKASEGGNFELINLHAAGKAVAKAVRQPLKVVDKAVDATVDALHLQKLHLQMPEKVTSSLNTHGAVSDALFAGLHAGLHELRPDLREELTEKAFQHAALRARRRVLWIPDDELGIGQDEAARLSRFSPFLEVSTEGAAINGKGKVIFGMSPPDFKEEDLIEL